MVRKYLHSPNVFMIFMLRICLCLCVNVRCAYERDILFGSFLDSLWISAEITELAKYKRRKRFSLCMESIRQVRSWRVRIIFKSHMLQIKQGWTRVEDVFWRCIKMKSTSKTIWNPLNFHWNILLWRHFYKSKMFLL